jgi:hypothetical protein
MIISVYIRFGSVPSRVWMTGLHGHDNVGIGGVVYSSAPRSGEVF